LARRVWRKLYWSTIDPARSELRLRLATAGDPQKRRTLRLVSPHTMVGRDRLINA